jgi:hypothetical protein
MSTGHSDHPKKPYRKPELRVHGDIRKITESSGISGKMDNSTKQHKQTG